MSEAKRKILVTGDQGLLGSSLLRFSKFREITGVCREQMDITLKESVERCLAFYQPDIVIHTAAHTDVEACEREPEKAYSVNALGTRIIADICKRNQTFLVYISSTGVYGSAESRAYTELDRVNPTTVHHRTKLDDELIVKEQLENYLVLRTGWLYGGPKAAKKNFVYKRYLEARENKKIYSNDRKVGNPTYVYDLVKQCDLLIEKNIRGLFNCVNSGENVTRYDYMKKIMKLFNQDCEVVPAGPEVFERVAPVSDNESAINFNLMKFGVDNMRGWEDAFTVYIQTLKKAI